MTKLNLRILGIDHYREIASKNGNKINVLGYAGYAHFPNQKYAKNRKKILYLIECNTCFKQESVVRGDQLLERMKKGCIFCRSKKSCKNCGENFYAKTKGMPKKYCDLCVKTVRRKQALKASQTVGGKRAKQKWYQAAMKDPVRYEKLKSIWRASKRRKYAISNTENLIFSKKD